MRNLFSGTDDGDPLEEIEILTDEYDVSHVYADDLYSLAYGNGYVQARDRLFQMEVFRLIGKDESASVLGSGQLASDIQVTRDLYTDEERQRMWEMASTTKEADTSNYLGISATGGETIPRINRGSWNHLVAFRDEPKRDVAEGVLPPSNTGHLTADEFANYLATGEQPDRLTDQLELYVNFEFKHLPLFREEVEAATERSETLVAGPSPRRTPEVSLDERFDASDLPLPDAVSDEAAEPSDITGRR